MQLFASGQNSKSQKQFGTNPATYKLYPEVQKLIVDECHSTLVPYISFEERVERMFKKVEKTAKQGK